MDTNTMKHIPNWTRFVQKYNPKVEFIEAFETRVDSIRELENFEKVAKYINIELGVLLLHHREIDEETLQEFMASFWEKKEED